jgi:glutamate-5-semialdehyde dehydrogenase
MAIDSAEKIASRAQQCGVLLASVSIEQRNKALNQMAALIESGELKILIANKDDMNAAVKSGAQEAFLSRLKLDGSGVLSLASTLRKVAQLSLPQKEISRLYPENGLEIRKVRVPLGAICVIFESRPDVAVEASALAIKSGCSIVLKGGKEAKSTNEAIISLLRSGLAAAGLEPDAIQLFLGTREELASLLGQSGKLDLVVPRGGEGLIRFVKENSSVPAIFAGGGNCHLYVHEDANYQMAKEIAINAKVQKPSACNAIETLLVDEKIAEAFLPDACKALSGLGVELRCCPKSLEILKRAGVAAKAASESDWSEEFLRLVLAVKVVSDLNEAASHINRYGTRHSEAIVTSSKEAYGKFFGLVDAAAIYWNASTRFTDGSQFGYGAELGISTQKLHVRGPMGLDTLFTYKYEIVGNGQVRQQSGGVATCEK